MGNEIREIKVPEVVVVKWRAERQVGAEVSDEAVVAQIRDAVAEQARLFIGHPDDVQMDISTAKRILEDPDKMARTPLAHIIVGMGIVEADKVVRAEVASAAKHFMDWDELCRKDSAGRYGAR